MIQQNTGALFHNTHRGHGRFDPTQILGLYFRIHTGVMGVIQQNTGALFQNTHGGHGRFDPTQILGLYFTIHTGVMGGLVQHKYWGFISQYTRGGGVMGGLVQHKYWGFISQYTRGGHGRFDTTQIPYSPVIRRLCLCLHRKEMGA